MLNAPYAPPVSLVPSTGDLRNGEACVRRRMPREIARGPLDETLEFAVAK